MKRVLLLYGGRSSEHPISCLSARSVLEVIDRSRYEVLPVGITKEGRWTLTDGCIENAPGARLPEVDGTGRTVGLVASRKGPRLIEIDDDGTPLANLGQVDVAFPLLHGPWGEDGTVQGLLATVGIAYVGADVTASSVGIDKSVMKATFASRALPQGGYVAVTRAQWERDPQAVQEDLVQGLPMPWFTKPSRQGSSIGISKVSDPGSLEAAMHEAFSYDEVVVVEEGIEAAREIEVGVLGSGDQLEVTRPGEIVPSHDFYDFEAKYLDDTQLIIPADVPDRVRGVIDRYAREAYQAIGCRGFARVDFFLRPDGSVLVNEINTIPGFTPTSMFPRLWAAEGLQYGELVDRLLDSARVDGAA